MTPTQAVRKALRDCNSSLEREALTKAIATLERAARSEAALRTIAHMGKDGTVADAILLAESGL